MPRAALRPAPTPAPAPLRIFSPDEADRTLPYLTRVAADVVRVYERVVTLRRQIEACDDSAIARALDRDYEQVMDRLSELVDEVRGVGGELRDFTKGQIDFPARVAGREVLLSWQRGEATVSHWREREDVTGPRRPLAELKAA